MNYEVFTHTIDNIKAKVRKSIITLILLAFVISASAQHLKPPKTYWQSFGYQKQPEYVQTVKYKSDSLGYEPTTVLVKSFNKDGFIIQDYIRVLGDFASETAHNYVYKNGLLDSINTVTSNKGFDGTQKLHYDGKGTLTHITSTGKYTSYTDTFTYENSGMLKTIQRIYAEKQGATTATFDHTKNVVTETDLRANGKKSTTHYVYNEDLLFATISGAKPGVVRFNNPFHQYDFEVETTGDALQYVFEKRKLFQQNEQYLGKLLEEKNGKIVLDKPAVSKNEIGDVIRHLELDKTYKTTNRRLVFSKYKYADGTESGSTDYDLIFGKRVEKMK